ncbi:MAG: phenylalanine--tRNA ligase subunit beta [Patescibacteria group bacterium]|nr:phenylalanine--tRNA ligase subunit beta [Patescibacteria group bacterium]MDE2218191.1 phenylalanine--tRNA ligase subunit beta [Patescibacteria group bacterium]
MKFSYNWLQNFFERELPAPEKLADVLTMHSFEVESIEQKGYDYIFDAKILPNMAHHCLSHRGVASEISAILDFPMRDFSISLKDARAGKICAKLEINVENSNFCRRYVVRIIEGVEIKPSPKWLKEKLESVGQKSINNVVDAANFVMLEIGQPMHAFDLDKLNSKNETVKIEVKNASTGDSITTLDEKEVALDEGTLIISGGNNPLAIAGIKGGKFAEIENATKNIIIESANFAPSLIRKTSRRLNILTDSSKRFENEISAEKASEAMEMMTSLIADIAQGKNTKVGNICDFYPNKIIQNKIEISLKETNDLLGTNMKMFEMKEILKRLKFNFETRKDDNLVVEISHDRLDIKIKEDLIEEIGRIYGYEKIKEQKIPALFKTILINKNFYYKNKIRNFLTEKGFSEVYTYAFTDKGEIEMENPIASDKKFLRENLKDGIKKSLDSNFHYIDILGLDQIKIFEIGKIFRDGRETDSLAVGIRKGNAFKGGREDDELKKILESLSKNLSMPIESEFSKDGVAETNFEKMIEKLPMPKSYEDIKIEKYDIGKLKYKKISPYPFVLRDIAVFVPQGVEEKDVATIIEKEAGELLVNKKLFDVFVKKFPDGTSKTSFAFRLVFQSQEKTLSDEEVNKIMEKISKSLNDNRNWQVR